MKWLLTNDHGESIDDRPHAVFGERLSRQQLPAGRRLRIGLRHRFAVVLGTYRRGKGETVFDTDLFLNLVPAVCRVVGHDSVDIRMDDGNRFPSFADLARHYAGQEEDDQDPPVRIELRKNGQVYGIVETEFWAHVGGPPPYHDSYTFSFYGDRDRSAELRRVSETVCSQLGAVITEYHEEQESKEPYRPWWRKVLRWFAATRY